MHNAHMTLEKIRTFLNLFFQLSTAVSGSNTVQLTEVSLIVPDLQFLCSALKRELHELPYTEMVKSGTIRLTSGDTFWWAVPL